MTTTPIPKLVGSLAVPTIISMLITSIYNMADTFFVGKLGTSASGAVGVVFSIMAVIQAVGFTLGMGSGSIISRKLGQHDQESANRFASTAFFTALAIGFSITVLGSIFLDPMMRAIGSTETILPYARSYARYILLAAPMMATSFVMNNILRFEGRAAFAMVGLTTGGILNIILDPIFIFVLDLGIAGAAIATGLSQLVSFCILLSMFLRHKSQIHLSIHNYTRRISDLGQILKTGMPSFFRQGFASLASIALNQHAALFGDAAVAAMSITMRISMFILSVMLGIGQGFQPVAAFNYGAQKYSRVRKAFKFTLGLGEIVMVILSSIIFFIAPTMITLFRDDPEVIRIGITALRFQCLALMLQAFGTCANMLLQSVGQSGKATFLACARQGIFFLPLVYTLPGFYGLLGVQIVQPIADVLTILFAIPLVYSFFKVLPKTDNA